MLLIPTYIARSPIHGIGVFAADDIPAGSRIWAFDAEVDWRLTADEMRSFPEPYQTRLRSWSYLDDEGLYVLCGDNARFMNHADSPNCLDIEGPYTITARDIAAGEELTCDYRTFDRETILNGLAFSG